MSHEYTNKILDLVEDGYDPAQLLNQLVLWLGEDQVKWFYEVTFDDGDENEG